MTVVSTSETIDEPFANEFVAAVRARFHDSGLLRDGTEWVAGGVQPPDAAVILYRDRPGGPVLGRRYLLREYSASSAVRRRSGCDGGVGVRHHGPSGDGERKDVDWADGLVRDPGDVRWLD